MNKDNPSPEETETIKDFLSVILDICKSKERNETQTEEQLSDAPQLDN